MVRHAIGWRLAGGLGMAFAVTLAAPPVQAQAAAVQQDYNLPAQDLGRSLREVAAESGRNIMAAAELIQGKTAPPLRGRLSADGRTVGGDIIVEQDPGRSQQVSQTSGDAGEIIVTGSRIGGAMSSSPVIELRREAMRSAGRTSVDDAIRAIPQNFSGGQNPGVSFNVPESSGSNIGGSSSVNLRGIGSDATLTLLDGHRLPYSAAFQSIDISAIPFGAIDRLEIVPDGASAIYGSDAVAGVVNVILRRDFTGVEASAKIGAATDGGYLLQQYGATAGMRWSSGNVMLAYEYDSNTSVDGSDRDYTAATPGLVLFPPQHQHDVALSGHQQISPDLDFSLDALFGQRATVTHYATDPSGDPAVSAYVVSSGAKSFSVAPEFDLAFGGGWHAALAGTYGRNRTTYDGGLRVGTVFAAPGGGYYINRGSSAQISADGALVALPGGTAKAAFGVAWRQNDFFRSTGTPTNDIRHTQNSYAAFGELNLPIVQLLTVTAALRYERYPGIGEVVTPKLGGILTVTPDIDIKANWGKSYRAPTIYEQFQPQFAYLEAATGFGATGYPASANALLSLGGNAQLKPERSTNWSASITLHPRAAPGLDLTLSYFSIDYKDRIVTPIPFFTQALSNPIYAPYVQFNPSAADQAAFIADSVTFTNYTGADYDPASVVAIVRDASINAGRQRIRGVDAAIAYASALGLGTFHASLDLAYLDSDQQVGADQAVTQLAGILFNPPNLKGRGELGYSVGRVTITGDITYLGPVRDTRTDRAIRVAGMTPVDMTLRYQAPNGGAFGGIDLILTAQNLFDEAPGRIATTLISDAPYDSTNYTPLGRVVSISVSKKW